MAYSVQHWGSHSHFKPQGGGGGGTRWRGDVQKAPKNAVARNVGEPEVVKQRSHLSPSPIPHPEGGGQVTYPNCAAESDLAEHETNGRMLLDQAYLYLSTTNTSSDM